MENWDSEIDCELYLFTKNLLTRQDETTRKNTRWRHGKLRVETTILTFNKNYMIYLTAIATIWIFDIIFSIRKSIWNFAGILVLSHDINSKALSTVLGLKK